MKKKNIKIMIILITMAFSVFNITNKITKANIKENIIMKDEAVEIKANITIAKGQEEQLINENNYIDSNKEISVENDKEENTTIKKNNKVILKTNNKEQLNQKNTNQENSKEDNKVESNDIKEQNGMQDIIGIKISSDFKETEEEKGDMLEKALAKKEAKEKLKDFFKENIN